jgi:hypothetical protein
MNSLQVSVMLRSILVILFVCANLNAEHVLHRFEMWGKSTELDKLNLYYGWTNGFLMGRGTKGLELADCLEEMTAPQAIAMIDKRFKDHPELWSHPLGEQILEAVTMSAAPATGKIPWTKIHISFSLIKAIFSTAR